MEHLREGLTAAAIKEQPLAHTLLFGTQGMGKSSLAKLVAADTGGGFIEVTASTLETPADMLRILVQLNNLRDTTGAWSTLFIDEIHALGQARGRQAIDQESIYSLLEDFVFYHNMQGKPFLGLDGITYTPYYMDFKVWPFTCIGATTEPGQLSAPLLRRFLIQLELEPYSEAEIVEIMQSTAGRLGWPLEPPAAVYLAHYARRNPGRSYSLLTAAYNRAVATHRDVDLAVAQEVIGRLKLYPLGLTETDVRILKVLAARPKGVGQAEIARAVGITLSHFAVLEPYLRLLNFTETLARRVIRPEGTAYLAMLAEQAEGVWGAGGPRAE